MINGRNGNVWGFYRNQRMYSIPGNGLKCDKKKTGWIRVKSEVSVLCNF